MYAFFIVYISYFIVIIIMLLCFNECNDFMENRLTSRKIIDRALLIIFREYGLEKIGCSLKDPL